MNRLKEIRARYRVTQHDLRIKTGINQTKISLAENGYVELRADEKQKIAQVLGVQPGEIWIKGDHHEALQ